MSAQSPIPIEEVLEHAEWLRRMVRDLVGDRHRADDVVQETWLRTLRRPPARTGSLRSWLLSVAKNASRDQWRGEGRRDRRERAAARGESVPDTTDAVARAELLREAVGAVLDLPEPYRETLLLRYQEGLEPAAIAARTGTPAGTVRSRIARGLELTRERYRTKRGDRWAVMLLPLLAEPAPAPLEASGSLWGDSPWPRNRRRS